MKDFYSIFVFASLIGVILLITCVDAYAEGPLRERIKQNFKERVLEKLEEAPAPETNKNINDKITSAGDYIFSVMHDSLKRMYHVHVPPQYTPEKKMPMLIAFHGGGGDMEYMSREEYYGLVSKSDKEGFVVVFPNGYSNFQSGKLATWNAGNCCGDARDLNIDDVGFVKVMIDNIKKQIAIDSERIFATGMSNGGLMAHRLACDMADTFRAISSVAGTDNTRSCYPSRPVSILVIHALNDDHVLFNGGAGEESFQKNNLKKVTDFTSVPETISRWVKRNRCNANPHRVLDVDGAYCDLYAPCAGNTTVKLCVTKKGGHSWAGGEKPGGLKQLSKEPTSKAISANDMMWNFFMYNQ